MLYDAYLHLLLLLLLLLLKGLNIIYICIYEKDITKRQNSLLLRVSCSRTHQTVFLSDECVSTKLGVTENFVSSLYLFHIQSSTLKSVLSTVLTALATLSHVYICIYIYIKLCTISKNAYVQQYETIINVMKHNGFI